MGNLSDPRYIKRIMAKHGFNPSKSLGQNFITDPSVCPKIAELGGADGDTGVLEIGPGIGVLTAELAARARKVVAVELDKRLPPILAETLAGFGNVTVISGDVLEMDLHELIAGHFHGMDAVVCANLPYYITSPVVMALLERKLPVRSVTVMVQKEAAQRLCADIPSRAAGASTIAVKWHSEPKLLFQVGRSAFWPPPDVDSAVIRLDIRKTPPVGTKSEDMFFRVVKAAFSQRRKTLQNCLSSFFAMDKAKIGEILAEAGVPASVRAEQLRLEDFARIADLIVVRK